MKKIQRIAIALVFAAATSVSANTKPFELGISIDYANFIDNCGNACVPLIQAFDAEIQAMKSALEDQVNAVLPKGDLKEMARNMGNASVMASKGQGVDYTSNDIFVVGGGVGLGLGLGSNSISDLTSGNINYENLPGFGVQVSGMVGFNLGSIKKLPALDLKYFQLDPKKFTVFFNYMGAQLPQSINANLKGSFNTWGVHLQYQLFDPKFVWKSTPTDNWAMKLLKPGLVNWSGVKLTSGLDYTDLRFQFLNTVNFTQTRSVGAVPGGVAQLKFDGAVGTGVDVRVLSIPFEISTGYQLGWIFEHYVGTGIDLAFGKADMIAAGGGFVSGGAPGFATIDGTAKINLGDPSTPSIMGARVFTGFNFKLLGAVKAFVHGNYGFLGNVYGVNLGARVGW